MLRVCILEADTLALQFSIKYKSYGRLFAQLFSQQKIPAECDVFSVKNGQYPPAIRHYDAYLVTGSTFDSFGQDEWIKVLKAFLVNKYQQGSTLLGVCFGHQLLALALGGDVVRSSNGWGVGLHQYQLASKPSWLASNDNEFSLLASHQDQVITLPKQAKLLAGNLFCPIAAYYIDQQVLCFQGHPEFTLNYSKELLNARRSQLDTITYEAAIKSLNAEQQGRLVGEWMLRFVSLTSI